MILDFHSVLRWLILLSGLVATLVAVRGWRAGASFSRWPGFVYVSFLHTQLLVAGFLYFSSPLALAAWRDPEVGLRNPEIRFFSLEHPLLMLVAMAIATLGAGASRRRRSWKVAALSFTLSLLLLLVGIPWDRRWWPL